MEIEAKFSIPDLATYHQLKAIQHLGDFTLSGAQTQTLQDTYMDTADRRLMQAGYAYRLRCTEQRYIITLKALGQAQDGLHRREEMALVLDHALPPHAWPEGPMRRRVLTLSSHQPLKRLFQLHQERATRLVQQGEQTVAEFSLDTVRQQHYDTMLTYQELEIECIAAGTEQDIQALMHIVQDLYALNPQSISKFEQGLTFIHAAMTETAMVQPPIQPSSRTNEKQPGIHPPDTIAQAFCKILRLHYQRMLENEAGTLAGEDAEALHDMRVATRRMRAAIRVFRKYLQIDALKDYRDNLKSIAQVLGMVRDMDVFHIKTERYKQSHTIDSAGFAPLFEDWNATYQQARHALQLYLNDTPYIHFKQNFTDFLEDFPCPPATGKIRPHRVQHIAPVILYNWLARLRAYDEWLAIPDAPLTWYHQLRITAKHLRYTLEFFQEILGPDTANLIQDIKKLQDHLGDLQDAVVADQRLQRFRERGTMLSGAANQVQPHAITPDIIAYHAARQAEIQQLVDTFPEIWLPFQQQDFNSRFAHAIAAL